MNDPLDHKLISAWEAIDLADRAAIIEALRKPTHLGAMTPATSPKRIKTELGFVVFDRFVTGLASQMIEAIEWRDGELQAKHEEAA
jgi:hypothetical protein